jgi:hypothetical protein
MRVAELGVANVDEAVLLLVVPAVLELRLPGESEGAVHLVVDELEDDVARVHVDGDERLDLDALLLAQVAEHHVGVRGEAREDEHQVLLHRGLVPLLEPVEGRVHLGRPPDLPRGEAVLCDEHVDPLLLGEVERGVDAVEQDRAHGVLLGGARVTRAEAYER